MEHINSKDELKERIKSCLDGLNYAINKLFYKRTLRMALDYMDQTEIQISNLQEELQEYRNAEEQGLLLRLPKSMHDIDKNIIEYALVMAINLSRYGVNVMDKIKSETELSYFLNQAYLRGRQDEIDRMNRIKEEEA